MKKKVTSLGLFLLFMVSGLFSQTYEQCDFYIRSSFSSECLTTTYRDPNKPYFLHDEAECVLACAGSSVAYYAENLPADYECEWLVSGTNNFIVNNNNNSITVHWPNELTTGNIVLTAVGPNNTICIKELCVELIERPVADIISNPTEIGYNDYGHKYINVCDGQQIQFFSNSYGSAEAPIVGYLWTTGIESWTTENIVFNADYNTYGDHVKLELTVVNECGCTHTTIYIIYIHKYPSLKVDCYGTVCENAEVTYTVLNHECEEYFWLVEGGDIVAGQQTPTVTVLWNDIADGYGYLAIDGHHCHEEICPYVTYLPIPILTETAVISGPEVVCVGDVVYYELPQWASTEYSWSLEPLIGVSTLFSGHPHKLMIQFNIPGTYILEASYNNEFLGCSGIGLSKEIIVKDEFMINSVFEACAGETIDFESNTGVSESYQWTILNGNMQTIHSSYSQILSYTFTNPGTYTIQAENNNYCKPAQRSIIIHELPAIPQPDNSDWVTEVCPNAGYIFSAELSDEQYYLHWAASCGEPQEFDGPEFNVMFGNSICNIELMHIDKITGCMSEPFVHELTEFEPEQISWDNYEVCANEIMNFSIPLEEGVLYEWSITQGHLASIVDGQYTNQITIQANAIAGNFNLILKRTFCNTFTTETIPILIKPFVQPQFELPDDICQNETLTLVPSNNSGVTGTWTWQIEGATTSIYGSASDATMNYTFNNSGVIPIRLSFTADGCSQSYTVINSLLVNPAPNISLSFNQLSPTQLVLSVTNALGNYSYEWSSGDTGPVVVLNNPTESTYVCTVTNLDTECSTSRLISIIDAENPEECLINEGSITYTLNCNTGIFNRTGFNPLYGNIYWSFGNNSSIPIFTISGTNNEICNAVFSNAGYYSVEAYQTYNDCKYWSNVEFVVPLIPRILINHKCEGTTDIELELINNSDYVTGVNIVETTWSININNNNLITDVSSPVVVSSGTHTIILDITFTYGGTQYTCSIEEEVTYSRGVADFTVSNAPYCSGSPIQFTDNSTNAVSWRWTLGADALNYSQNPQQTLYNYSGNPANATINLIILDNLGCSSSKAQTLSINPNSLLGNLGTNYGPFCSGTEWLIDYNFGPSNNPNNYNINWYESSNVSNAITNNVNTNNALQTGFYYVTLNDNNGCIAQSEFLNLCFLNTPHAFISGNDNYCNYDNIRLFGHTGAYEYTWEGLGTDIYDTPNISIPAEQLTPGIYDVTLTVTNDICSSSTQRTITIHPTPPTPNIQLGANSCLHSPPVYLQSVNGTNLYWSTGVYGIQTATFNAGIHSAHYLDNNTGCKSNYAYINVPKPPDFNELMTGCFEFCKEDLPKYILGPMGYFNQWDWILNDSYSIDHGIGQIPELIIPYFGSYNLEVAYPIGCVTKSDELVINEKEYCDTCNIKIKARGFKCKVAKCKIIIVGDITITNLSPYHTATLHDIVSPGIELLSPNLPLSINPNSSVTIPLYFLLEYYEPQIINAEFVFSEGGKICISNLSIDLSEVIKHCIRDCDAKFIDAKFVHDLSSESVYYYKFVLGIDPYQHNVQVYSDDCQIINYSYDYNSGYISGLFAITPLNLQNMVNNDEEICFTVYFCKHDVICKAITCFPAQFLDVPNAKNSSLAKEIEQDSQKANPYFTDKYGISPNPAKNTILITGADEDLISVTIMDLMGKIIITTDKKEINIDKLISGQYIVKIINSQNKVQYLKLIKQ